MKRTTFNTLFYIQKTRITKNGQVPVLLRVTINGQRVVISVNVKVNPECIAKGVLLPTLCNQKMNMYLKELAAICGINKEISSHSGRYTFATSVALANGVSIENVAKMLGHSDTNKTCHYARVLDKSIKRDMDMVNTKFAGLNIVLKRQAHVSQPIFSTTAKWKC